MVSSINGRREKAEKRERSRRRGREQKRSFERGLANIYKLLFELTLLSGFRPLPIYYFFCSKTHRVSTMGHIEESGGPKILEGGEGARTSQIQEATKTQNTPTRGGSGQQGQVTYDMLRCAGMHHDSVTPPHKFHQIEGWSPFRFSHPAP